MILYNTIIVNDENCYFVRITTIMCSDIKKDDCPNLKFNVLSLLMLFVNNWPP